MAGVAFFVSGHTILPTDNITHCVRPVFVPTISEDPPAEPLKFDVIQDSFVLYFPENMDVPKTPVLL